MYNAADIIIVSYNIDIGFIGIYIQYINCLKMNYYLKRGTSISGAKSIALCKSAAVQQNV